MLRRLPHLFAFLLFLAASASPGAATETLRVGSIDGTVTAAITEQPIESVLVHVEGSNVSAMTDSAGRFRIEPLPTGTYRLRLTAAGRLPAVIADVVVTADRETTVTAQLREAVHLSDAVTVAASYFSQPEGVTTDAFSMSYEEVRRAPGAVGDVGRMIQSLPAAIARDDQRNDIVARGGSPSENLILVDGIEVPNISHFAGQGTTGGPVTMLNAETISDVSFLAGGFPAAYGNRLSSVLPDSHLDVRQQLVDHRERHTSSPRRLKRAAGAPGRSRIEPANHAIARVAATSHQPGAGYATAAGMIKASTPSKTTDRPSENGRRKG